MRTLFRVEINENISQVKNEFKKAFSFMLPQKFQLPRLIALCREKLVPIKNSAISHIYEHIQFGCHDDNYVHGRFSINPLQWKVMSSIYKAFNAISMLFFHNFENKPIFQINHNSTFTFSAFDFAPPCISYLQFPWLSLK